METKTSKAALLSGLYWLRVVDGGGAHAAKARRVVEAATPACAASVSLKGTQGVPAAAWGGRRRGPVLPDLGTRTELSARELDGQAVRTVEVDDVRGVSLPFGARLRQ
jgi:hypothetical protein